MIHPPLSRHHPHLKYLDHRELGALYWSVFIKGVGDSLISIFTAIYLLSLGFSLRHVAIFYIVYFAVVPLLYPGSMRLCRSWGVKKTLGLGTALLVVYYFLLTLVEGGFPYWATALVYGIGGSLYWAAFQVDLAGALRSRSSGRSLSNVKIFSILAGILGPVVGAIFIVSLSFASLFIIVALILAGSVIPLLRRGDYRIHEAVPTLKESLSSDSSHKGWMYILFGITESALDILWPIFLFLNYPNLLSLGGIVSITSFLMLAVIYLAGKFADRNMIQTYRIGVLSHAPTWVVRLLWLTPGGLLVSNFLSAATSSLIAITVDQTMYRDAKSAPNALTALLFRSYYTAFGRITILAIAVLTNSSVVLFILLAFITLLQLLVAPHHHKLTQKEA